MQENTEPKMLLEVVREVVRLRHLSYKTEKHYLFLDPTLCAFSWQTPSGADGGRGDSCISLLPSNRQKLLAINTESSAQRLGDSVQKCTRSRPGQAKKISNGHAESSGYQR
jgi:hypothetical protein